MHISTAKRQLLLATIAALTLLGSANTALAQSLTAPPSAVASPTPQGTATATPVITDTTAMPSAAPTDPNVVQDTCASISDRAMASDLRSANAQAQKADNTQLARLVDESIALWTLAVQRCEGRGQERARRNLIDSERSRTGLTAALSVNPACTAGQKDAGNLQELAQQALRERRWTDAALLYRKAENMWDVTTERCTGEAQQIALQRRDQTAVDAHNAEFCAPVFENARQQSQQLRRIAGDRASPDKQAQSQAAETLWRQALNQCRGAAQDVARNNADQIARDRGTPWAATVIPGTPPATVATTTPVNDSNKAAKVGSVADATPPTAVTPLTALTHLPARSSQTLPIPQPLSVPTAGESNRTQDVDLQVGDTRFVGSFLREGNTFTGNGQIQWTNGDKYSGDVVKGQRHGQGNFVWASGQRYSGPWINDEAQGKGQMGFANGDRYEGDVARGLPHGQGKMLYAVGDLFEGRFNQGKPDTQGLYRWANGQQYEGAWFNEKPHGQGKIRFANGNLFEGQFQLGKPEGHGSLNFASGDRYEGSVSQGVPHGVGHYRWANGDQFQGLWLHGKKHGKGRMQWANGDVWEGRFDNDSQSAEGVLTRKGG